MNRVRGVVLGAAVIASVAFSVAPAGADAAAPNSHRVVGAESASRFWTPKRMRAALSNGAPGEARARSGQTARVSSIGVGDASTVDERMNGRIFGIDPRQGPYSCSGTAIDTPSRSIVLTAGHCVVENWSWGTHLVFVPAFDHGEHPFGIFAADAVYVTPQWRRTENTDYDVAALQVSPNEFGTLVDVVGARGFEFNRPRYLSLEVFGYPAGALDGQVLRECESIGLGSDPLTFPLPGPPTLPTRCDMAAGSSGGAWVADGQYVNGVTSYSYIKNRAQLFSPYFGAEIGAFLTRLP
jgi:V8-like Glu-specific endopeptidase